MLSRLKALFGVNGTARDDETVLSGLNATERELIKRIRARRLTYLANSKLACLARTVREIETKGLPGVIIEAGCALGGSSILLANLKSDTRALMVYDVFGTIPPPTKEDTLDVHERYRTIIEGKSVGIDGDQYYGYVPDLYDVVQTNFKNFGVDIHRQCVQLIKGLVQDTMTIEQPVALAHVDVDWYEPVMTCMDRIAPNLVIGGCIILDDYHDWGGCRKAADEYLRLHIGQFALDDSAGSMKLTRVY